jgi:uncharacterized protein
MATARCVPGCYSLSPLSAVRAPWAAPAARGFGHNGAMTRHRFSSVRRASWVLGLALLLAPQAWAERPQLQLPRTTLSAGMHLIQAQVASTPEQRSIGLMFRTAMPANEGMLFVFEHPGEQCFWMKNTLIPLTAAFIADDGTIVNLADMQAQQLDSHCSRAPVRYVLEMNQGWFAKRGIRAGAKLKGPWSR